MSKFFGGIFGLAAALAALLAWGIAILGVVHALFYGLAADRAVTLYQAGIILIIAILCTVMAARWLRHAFGGPGRHDGGPIA